MRHAALYALAVLSLAVALVQSSLAEAEKPKAEDVLKRMADYLGKLPAYSARLSASLDIKAPDGEEQHEFTKMTARVERPNKLSLIVNDGKMGLTLVSDGKQLAQYLGILKRYAISEAPATYAEMADVGVPLKPTILGATTSLIPTGSEDYLKQLMSGVQSSAYVGQEKIGNFNTHHLRFIEKRFDWDIWIRDGKEPVVEKLVVDMSKEYAEEKAHIGYTVSFSDWNVAPKFTASDFAFKAPAGAEQVDQLIEPEPPHPLLGKPAPAFKTVGLDGKPFDLKSQLGKNVIMLDFWSTSCQPCLMLMPELEAVAEKYKDRGVMYRAVNGGEDADSLKEFVKAMKIKAPIVLDPNLEIWRAYGVEPIPQTVLIGKDGKVQVVHLGYSPALGEQISKQVEALLAGKDLASAELAKRKSHKKRAAAANSSNTSDEAAN
jgi:peroxiredoxin